MLKCTLFAAAAALAALTMATAADAGGLPTGKRQHKPVTLTRPLDKTATSRGPSRSGPGVLRSMDGGSTWHRATGPSGSVKFTVDSRCPANTGPHGPRLKGKAPKAKPNARHSIVNGYSAEFYAGSRSGSAVPVPSFMQNFRKVGDGVTKPPRRGPVRMRVN